MKAMISRPDAGVTGLKPLRYRADQAWLVKTAVQEARAILAVTEPAEDGWHASYCPAPEESLCLVWDCPVHGYVVREVLAESLAAFLPVLDTLERTAILDWRTVDTTSPQQTD